MQNKTKITAIVPAYNVENYIVAAIDSLLNQTEKFHEIIIVNDGSTDGTGTLIDQYQDIAGVKIFHTKNSGQGCARNFSLSQSSGDYVYFFDSDDLLNADFVASMHALVRQKPEIDIIYFSGESFLDEGCSSEYMPSYDRKIDMEYASGIEATGSMLRRDVYFASPCLYLSKRALWDDNKLSFMNIVHEDEEIIMRLSCSAGVSHCLSTVFFKRRIRQESTMTLPKSQRNALGYLRTLESIAAYCKTNRVQVVPIRGDLVRRFYNILRGYFALCKAIDVRPEYKKLFVLFIQLGRFPAPRQLYEMWVPPAFHARISTVKRKLCK
ncbi:MAG: glycosyltransferase family A protein [Burkholderiaceae bacterium]